MASDNTKAAASQAGPAATAATAEKSPAEKSPLQDLMERPVSYKPFMGSDVDEITLTPRMVLNYLARPTKSGKWPQMADLVRFIQLCKARALNPWEGDAFLVGYDSDGGAEFNLITAHQAFLKRAEVHPEYDGMESGVTVEVDGDVIDKPGDYVHTGEKLVAGWARVHFKNRTIPSYQRIALTTYSTGRSRWSKDAAGMISKVAEAHALRIAFPTKLGGLYLNDEFDGSGPIDIGVEVTPPAGATKSQRLADEMRTRGAPPHDQSNGHGNGHGAPEGETAGAGETGSRQPGDEG